MAAAATILHVSACTIDDENPTETIMLGGALNGVDVFVFVGKHLEHS